MNCVFPAPGGPQSRSPPFTDSVTEHASVPDPSRCLRGGQIAQDIVQRTERGDCPLLEQGTDMRYGARHLKRSIERLELHPLPNLMAAKEVNTGDWIEADVDG